MKLTENSKDVLKDRVGLPVSAKEKLAQTAFDEGLQHKECVGKLHKYVSYLYNRCKRGNQIRLYGNHVYMFHNGRLITVFTIDNAHLNASLKLQKRKKEAKRQ